MTPTPTAVPRRLVFRLSSLGDVILATAILRDGVKTDWVCAEEYVSLLEGHPGIDRIIGFRRSAGTDAWVRLCAELAVSGRYDEVVDLHGSLRTRVARVVWMVKGARKASTGVPARWRSVSKQRARRGAYAIFKALLPKALRPTAYVERVRELSAKGLPGTDLKHLVRGEAGPAAALGDAPYFALMPSSRWPSKEWPASAFADALARLAAELGARARFVILGRDSDRASVELLEECRRRELAGANGPVVSGIGEFNYAQLAGTLARARGYIGVDTGLAHLAESVGTEVFTVFGPTTPDYGFGPWRPGSVAAGKRLWCRPCSKDGRACFRVSRRYACIKEYSAEEASEALVAWARAKVRA